MNNFTAEDTLIIVGIVIVYILFTTWLTFRLRSKNTGDFMEGSRAMPAYLRVTDAIWRSLLVGAEPSHRAVFNGQVGHFVHGRQSGAHF